MRLSRGRFWLRRFCHYHSTFRLKRGRARLCEAVHHLSTHQPIFAHEAVHRQDTRPASRWLMAFQSSAQRNSCRHRHNRRSWPQAMQQRWTMCCRHTSTPGRRVGNNLDAQLCCVTMHPHLQLLQALKPAWQGVEQVIVDIPRNARSFRADTNNSTDYKNLPGKALVWVQRDFCRHGRAVHLQPKRACHRVGLCSCAGLSLVACLRTCRCWCCWQWRCCGWLCRCTEGGRWFWECCCRLRCCGRPCAVTGCGFRLSCCSCCNTLLLLLRRHLRWLRLFCSR